MDAIKIFSIILLAAAPVFARLDANPHIDDLRQYLQDHHPELIRVNFRTQDGRVNSMIVLPLGEGKSRRMVIVASAIGDEDDWDNIGIEVWFKAYNAVTRDRKLFMYPAYYVPEKRTGAERPASK